MKQAEIDEMLKSCQETGRLPGFAMSGVPVPVFKKFMENINENYAGCYWAKLQELMLKADAYDAMMYAPEQPVVEENDEVQLFGKGD